MFYKSISLTFATMIVILTPIIANAETIHLKKQASVVSLIFEPEYATYTDRPVYRANFAVKWGSYHKTNFRPNNSSGNYIIVRFNDWDGSGYSMEVTPKGNTKFIGYDQGATLEELRKMYPYATIYTCGSTISC